MPNPKDPQKFQEYREKQRAIALAKGYGKWTRGKKTPKDVIEKRRITLIRVCNSPEHRELMSAVAKANGFGRWMVGRKSSPRRMAWLRTRKGKTYIEIYGDRAIEEANKRKQGNRRRFDGVVRKTDQRPKHAGSFEYTEWRTAVFVRDDYTCKLCGKRGMRLHAHHIMSWSSHPSLRFVVGNGISLCVDCHKFIHTSEGRVRRVIFMTAFKQKSACVERLQAFDFAGATDPLDYADRESYKNFA